MKSQSTRNRVREVIEQVEAAPDPAAIIGLKTLTGASNAYRIRVGDYRIGVTIEGDLVQFARFLHRRGLYRFLL